MRDQRPRRFPLYWGFTPNPTAGDASPSPSGFPRGPGVSPPGPPRSKLGATAEMHCGCASDSRPYLVDKTADRMLPAWQHRLTGFIEPSEYTHPQAGMEVII